VSEYDQLSIESAIHSSNPIPSSNLQAGLRHLRQSINHVRTSLSSRSGRLSLYIQTPDQPQSGRYVIVTDCGKWASQTNERERERERERASCGFDGKPTQAIIASINNRLANNDRRQTARPTIIFDVREHHTSTSSLGRHGANTSRSNQAPIQGHCPTSQPTLEYARNKGGDPHKSCPLYSL
jgi:hypothetical protein